MNGVSVSSLSVSDPLRLTLQRLQGQLAQKQTELASGKLADAGLTLGDRTGRIDALGQHASALQTYLDGNTLATTRLEASQAALSSIASGAQDTLSNLVSDHAVPVDPATVKAAADSALRALSGALNTSVDGEYLFGGVNSGVRPIADYPGVPTGVAKLAVDAAFQSAFGFAANDPQAVSISPAALGSFIDSQFATLFAPPAFQTVSSASDTPQQTAIAAGETVRTSVSANAPALRKLFQAYTLVSELSTGSLSPDAFRTVIDKAIGLVGGAVPGLTEVQADLGVSQKAITDTGRRLALQQDILTRALGSLQDVDPYETNTKINTLTTQIEAAYSLTSRLQQLSLLKYL